MNQRLRTRIANGFVLLALVALGLLGFGQSVELVATSAVPITAEPSIDPQVDKILVVLQAGDRVGVVSCVDLKHYIVPEIQLPDGRVGFVAGGDFELVRSAYLTTLGKPIVFSCP